MADSNLSQSHSPFPHTDLRGEGVSTVKGKARLKQGGGQQCEPGKEHPSRHVTNSRRRGQTVDSIRFTGLKGFVDGALWFW